MGNYPDRHSIILDGTRFKVVEPVGEQNVSTFPGKVTFGDYGAESNDLLSQWNFANGTGGHGVADLEEGTDQNRYRISNGIYTRYPRQFTKCFAFSNDTTYSSGSSDYRPGLDMYYDTSGEFEWYAVSGASLIRDDTSIGSIVNANSRSQWAVFQGDGPERRLFIPQGNAFVATAGYTDYVRSTNTISQHNKDATHPAAIAFQVFDDRQLFAIDLDGQLWSTTDASVAFSSLGATAKLDGSVTPWGLFVYPNQAGENSLYIVGDLGVWAFDPGGPRLWKTNIELPPHPYAGICNALWRGNIYIAAGMDLIEWNGQVQRNIGLSRDDGLPWVYQGHIVSLQPSLNSLYAQVWGRDNDDGLTNWSVHEWSGTGWFQVFSQLDAHPTWMGLSRVSDDDEVINLYAGQKSPSVYGRFRMGIPVAFTNPREAIDNGEFSFGWDPDGSTTITGAEYTLESGRFDAGMAGYAKTANAIELDVRHLPDGEQIHIDYRINQDTAWTQLDDDDPLSAYYNPIQVGHNVLPFGTPDADGITPGVLFRFIEWRLRYTDDDTPTGNTSVVENIVTSFVKQRKGSYSYTVTLDLQEGYDGESAQDLRDRLDEIIDAGLFVAMKHRQETKRVRLAQVTGAGDTGYDERGQRTISLLEIPLSLSPSG